MRPHLLTIEALGPYAGHTTVEFDPLAEEGLFLIHGRTGSGKTFLLDALCLALYGEVSGERGKHTLRSGHADPRATPRVELEFSVHGRRYRVRRVPAHTVPKQRGEGLVDKPPKASLDRLDDGGWVPLSASVTETTREVEGLIGLDAAQFRQVILLPQGRFEQVLRSDSAAREGLLKTLFDTVLYERVAHWLDERAKSCRAAVTDQERAQQVRRDQAAREWSPYRVDASDEPVVADQADLDKLVSAIEGLLERAHEQLEVAECAERAASEHQRNTELLAERWHRLDHARQRKRVLEDEADEIGTAVARLARAERAEQLRSSLERAGLATDSHLEATRRLHSGADELERVRRAAPSLPTPVADLDLSTGDNLTAEVLDAAANALAGHRAWLGELGRKAAVADEAAAQSREAGADAARWRAEIARLDDELRQHRGRLDEVTAAVSDARAARDQLDGLRAACESAADRLQAIRALTELVPVLDEVRRSANSATSAHLDARTRALDLRQRYLDGVAAELAGSLADGDPCPVCGSGKHPHPARPAEGAVRREEYEQAEHEAERLEGEADTRLETVNALSREAAVLETRAGDAAGDPAAASATANTALALWELARDRAAALDQLEEDSTRLEAETQRLIKAAEQARIEEQKDSARADAEQQRADRLAGEVAADLGEDVVPASAERALTPVVDAVEALRRAATELTEARVRAEEAGHHLAREIAASPFATADEAGDALLGGPERERLAAAVEAHRKAMVETAAVLDEPALADLPPDRPDTVAAQERVDEAMSVRTAAIEFQKGAADRRGELVRLAEEHREGDRVLARLRDAATLTSGIADRCAGKLAPKVSLQRWVLAAYLEDICRYANTRLGSMSAGRYQLRVHRDGERGGKGSGLGLRVLDAHTGDEREVSTLSGGETFQASLALALGVADAVQAHSGGVHLDALFIDEGFGTLDPDALQLAMDELDRLREGGRMVGIISHVGALRERITMGIEVRPSESGSTLRIGDLSGV
jgi:DNA repair protein SbcC/Rad50